MAVIVDIFSSVIFFYVVLDERVSLTSLKKEKKRKEKKKQRREKQKNKRRILLTMWLSLICLKSDYSNMQNYKTQFKYISNIKYKIQKSKSRYICLTLKI